MIPFDKKPTAENRKKKEKKEKKTNGVFQSNYTKNTKSTVFISISEDITFLSYPVYCFETKCLTTKV